MDLNQIRESFLSFFSSKNHLIQSSASLIPANDDSILFVNAGMVPFKPFFLNQVEPPAKNLVSCQRCIRAGGKHNDLDQVGYTKRHHTFFEMCGNFSFGGYGHEGAIQLAWEYLTQVLKVDIDRLHVTVHPEDLLSYNIWSGIINKAQIYKLTENEWSMGATGPCGMCTEIFYDHGEHLSGTILEGDRFVEIWNLVTMTHEVNNTIKTELSKTCIDTGMGLERITAVLNGTDDNYMIPFFRKILEELSATSGTPIGPAFKILIDHARATSFAIADGVIPDNWGRGYVLRKIIRRALKNGSLEMFQRCINYTIEEMPTSHLNQARQKILEMVSVEAELLHSIVKNAKGNIIKLIGNSKKISGENLYTLYDRHGISLEIVQEVVQELGGNFQIDFEEFEGYCTNKGVQKTGLVLSGPGTEFLGYDALVCEAMVLDLLKQDGASYLITDRTVFYAESGGQEADQGLIIGDDWSATVLDVIKTGEIHAHKITYTGSPSGKCRMQVDSVRRKGLAQHHSATHLLSKALETFLGDQVTQQGSLVKSDGLRFDFSYPKQVDEETLLKVEQKVNEWIQENIPARISIQTLDSAKASGASSMSGEKYPSMVRVVELGDSKELCCGTHVISTGDIGGFYILKESSVRASVRRIEAKAGMSGYRLARQGLSDIKQLSSLLKTTPEHIFKSIEKLLLKPKENRQEVIQASCEGRFKDKSWKIIIYQAAAQQVLLKKSDELVKEVDFVLIANYIENNKTGLLCRGISAGELLGKVSRILMGGPSGGKTNISQAGVPGNPTLETLQESLLISLEELSH